MNIIIFVAFIAGVLIVGYDGLFNEEPALLFAASIIIISATPIVLFQDKMKKKKFLMTLSLLGLTAGSLYLWFLARR